MTKSGIKVPCSMLQQGLTQIIDMTYIYESRDLKVGQSVNIIHNFKTVQDIWRKLLGKMKHDMNSSHDKGLRQVMS